MFTGAVLVVVTGAVASGHEKKQEKKENTEHHRGRRGARERKNTKHQGGWVLEVPYIQLPAPRGGKKTRPSVFLPE